MKKIVNGRYFRRILLLSLMAATFGGIMTGAYMESCAEYPDPPEASLDDCTGDLACPAGGARRKDGLKNIYHSYFHECVLGVCVQFEWWGAKVTTSWGYTPATGAIRWRDSDVTSWHSEPVGTITIPWSGWITSQCFTGGMDTCLTRREWQARGDADFDVGITTIHVHQYQYGCVATRINGDGSHSRNAFEGHCPGSASADALSYDTAGTQQRWQPPKTKFAHSAGTRLGKLERMNLGHDRRVRSPVRGLQDLVSPGQAEALTAACWQRANAMQSAACKKVVREVYNTLTPAQKRVAADVERRVK